MKKLLSVFFACLLLALCCVSPVNAAPMPLSDGADLLTDGEESELLLAMQKVSETCGAQISLVTRSSLDEDIEDYAEFLYDSEGYGTGADRDGVLFVVSMDPREFWILCNGFPWHAIGPGGVDEITENITPSLSAGNYADAFKTYVSDCSYYLNNYLYGGDDGESGAESDSFDLLKTLLISAAVGLAVGLIYALILKGQLRSVKRKSEANSYVKAGSMTLTQSGDYFMYRNVTRTEKPQNNSSSRSGGSSRGGGGGRF